MLLQCRNQRTSNLFGQGPPVPHRIHRIGIDKFDNVVLMIFAVEVCLYYLN
jgi:hypothetical protein